MPVSSSWRCQSLHCPVLLEKPLHGSPNISTLHEVVVMTSKTGAITSHLLKKNHS